MIRLIGLLILTAGAFGLGYEPTPWPAFCCGALGVVGFALALQADRKW
jgi:hypothetical protein